MMPTISTDCRECGQAFEPTPEDIRQGNWHVCPACRSRARPP